MKNLQRTQGSILYVSIEVVASQQITPVTEKLDASYFVFCLAVGP
jgi:hypothetical protein